MAKYIKNTTNGNKTWVGQLVSSGDYYEIQSHEEAQWANDSTLLTDIGSGDAVVAKDDSGTTDITDVATGINHLKDIVILPYDSDNAPISRVKAAKSGWTYHLTAPEFITSTINSLVHQDVSGNNLNEASVKFYDTNNTELTTQGSCDIDCVKTVFTFEPTWNYEIIGGTLKTIGTVTENVRIWVIAVPDISAQYGGSKVMVQGANLKFIDPNNGIEADGRASKYMAYSATYHTNKLQVTIKHPAGHKEDIMMAFEVFRS